MDEFSVSKSLYEAQNQAQQFPTDPLRAQIRAHIFDTGFVIQHSAWHLEWHFTDTHDCMKDVRGGQCFERGEDNA